MTDEAELRRELVSLRGRRGMVAGATKRCPAWLELLSVTPEELERRVRNELETMPQNREVLALRSAFGIDNGQESTLDRRRAAYAATRDEAPKPETLKDWEEKAIKELATRLSVHLGSIPATIGVRGELNEFGAIKARIGIERGRQLDTRDYIAERRDGYPSAQVLSFYQGGLKQEEWNVERLLLIMSFEADALPRLVWAASSSHFLEALSGHARQMLDLEKNASGTYSAAYLWGNPGYRTLYCIAWQY